MSDGAAVAATDPTAYAYAAATVQELAAQLTQTRAALTAISTQATEGETLAALGGRRDLVRCFAAISRQARRALALPVK